MGWASIAAKIKPTSKKGKAVTEHKRIHQKTLDKKKDMYPDGINDNSPGALYHAERGNFKTEADKKQYIADNPEQYAAYQADKRKAMPGYDNYRVQKKAIMDEPGRVGKFMGSTGGQVTLAAAGILPMGFMMLPSGGSEEAPAEEPPADETYPPADTTGYPQQQQPAIPQQPAANYPIQYTA
jgi:hypothetical protein